MKSIKNILLLFFLTTLIIQVQAQEGGAIDNLAFTFKANFPSKPDFQQRSIPSPMGDLTLNLYVCEGGEADENLLYLVNATAYPAETVHSDSTDKIEAFYQGAISGAASNVNGKVLTRKAIEVNGYEGREVTIKMDADGSVAIIRSRMVLIQNVIYMMQTIAEEGKDGNQAAQVFLESFEYYGKK
ncbi:MAG: hypothetical protein AAF135_04750 [Bacteroidota bacterium]